MADDDWFMEAMKPIIVPGAILLAILVLTAISVGTWAVLTA